MSLLEVVSVRREVNIAPKLPGIASSLRMEVGSEGVTGVGTERSVEIGGTEDRDLGRGAGVEVVRGRDIVLGRRPMRRSSEVPVILVMVSMRAGSLRAGTVASRPSCASQRLSTSV